MSSDASTSSDTPLDSDTSWSLAEELNGAYWGIGIKLRIYEVSWVIEKMRYAADDFKTHITVRANFTESQLYVLREMGLSVETTWWDFKRLFFSGREYKISFAPTLRPKTVKLNDCDLGF